MLRPPTSLALAPTWRRRSTLRVGCTRPSRTPLRSLQGAQPRHCLEGCTDSGHWHGWPQLSMLCSRSCARRRWRLGSGSPLRSVRQSQTYIALSCSSKQSSRLAAALRAFRDEAFRDEAFRGEFDCSLFLSLTLSLSLTQMANANPFANTMILFRNGRALRRLAISRILEASSFVCFGSAARPYRFGPLVSLESLATAAWAIFTTCALLTVVVGSGGIGSLGLVTRERGCVQANPKRVDNPQQAILSCTVHEGRYAHCIDVRRQGSVTTP